MMNAIRTFLLVYALVLVWTVLIEVADDYYSHWHATYQAIVGYIWTGRFNLVISGVRYDPSIWYHWPMWYFQLRSRGLVNGLGYAWLRVSTYAGVAYQHATNLDTLRARAWKLGWRETWRRTRHGLGLEREIVHPAIEDDPSIAPRPSYWERLRQVLATPPNPIEDIYDLVSRVRALVLGVGPIAPQPESAL